MAAGDTYHGISSVAGSGTLTIQPASGVEAVIHNIVVTGAADLKKTDGTHTVTLKSLLGNPDDCWDANTDLHVTNGDYIIVVDTSTSTNVMAYDGMQTK